jgi:hypothetical protein
MVAAAQAAHDCSKADRLLILLFNVEVLSGNDSDTLAHTLTATSDITVLARDPETQFQRKYCIIEIQN